MCLSLFVFFRFSQLLGTLFGTLILIFSFNGSNLRTFELFDGPNMLQKMVMSILLSFLSTFVLLITNFAVVQPVRHHTRDTHAPQGERGVIAQSPSKPVCCSLCPPLTDPPAVREHRLK